MINRDEIDSLSIVRSFTLSSNKNYIIDLFGTVLWSHVRHFHSWYHHGAHEPIADDQQKN